MRTNLLNVTLCHTLLTAYAKRADTNLEPGLQAGSSGALYYVTPAARTQHYLDSHLAHPQVSFIPPKLETGRGLGRIDPKKSVLQMMN